MDNSITIRVVILQKIKCLNFESLSGTEKHYGIPYCVHIKVLVLSKAGLKMAALAAETCSHALLICSTYYCELLLCLDVNIYILL